MASVQGIYIALFGRPADPRGLAFYQNATNNGANLDVIYGSLAGEEEYLARFEGLSSDDIINSIYQSLFERDAQMSDLAYWVEVFENGTYTIEQIAIAIYDAAQNQDLAMIQAKEAAANMFTASINTQAEINAYVGGDAIAFGIAFLQNVTSNPASQPSQAQVDAALQDLVAGVQDLTVAEALESEDLPTFYRIVGESFDAGAVTIAEAMASLAAVTEILEGAVNSDELDIADYFTWSIEDSADNILANADDPAITGADSVTATESPSGPLTVAEAEALLAIATLGEGVTFEISDSAANLLAADPALLDQASALSLDGSDETITSDQATGLIELGLDPDTFPPVPSSLLTTGIDVLTIGEFDTVVGTSATWDEGDSITGSSGTVNFFFTDSTEAGSLDNISVVNINPNGTVVVNAENWTNIEQVNIIEVDDNTDFLMREIQGTEIPSILANDVEVGSTVTLHFDGQDLNTSDKTVNVAVREFNGTLELQTDANSSTETVNLDVQDTEDFGSTMEDLIGVDTKTLNISGGAAGLAFTIVGALDASITTLDAAELESDASLNVSESTETMTVTLGSGDDTIDFGDTLVDDTVDGGEGDDTVVAEFTDNGTRMPTMTSVESLDAVFNAAVTFDGTNVDDLATANLGASTGRADFNNMDETFATINVEGNLDQGVEVDYDGEGETDLTVNIVGGTTAIGNAGNDSGIEARNATSFALNHNGTANVTVSNGIRVDEDTTESVTITNNSAADLTVNESNDANTVIVDGNAVETLSIVSTAAGDVFLPGIGGDLMSEAGSLQTYSITSASDSDIAVGSIGTDEEAEDLENITISAGVSSFIDVGEIEADGPDGAATIDQIAITTGTSAQVTLRGDDWLSAASVNQMTINSAQGAVVQGDAFGDVRMNAMPIGGLIGAPDFDFVNRNNLIGLDLNAQAGGSLLEVSGAGTVSGFLFANDNFATIDAVGLTGSGLTVIHADPTDASGFTFNGSNQADQVSATHEDDVLNGNGGDDVLIGLFGDDVVNGGAGNDRLYGDTGYDEDVGDTDGTDITSDFGNTGIDDDDQIAGNDVLDGGAGNDIIVGGANGNADPDNGIFGDVLTGGAGADQFWFDFTDGKFPDAVETGKSNNPNGFMQDTITDFSGSSDVIFIDTDGAFTGNYLIAVYEDDAATIIGAGDPTLDVRMVARIGNYNENGTFNQDTNGADVQLLFNEDAGSFGIAPFLNDGGDVLFNEAEFEIALEGAANQFGSISSSWVDFV
ncbi:DUF4214 domain-containing protein [Pararhizobium haloflavum]|uniref:DUF4214 domain-containing protein n=1 Tax=Pararhizobium haloflavum TaxID=2037914 RepID=UPI000C1A1672|nr:DUF4214 domain-containing protein [Pararhizobium haloflavum]